MVDLTELQTRLAEAEETLNAIRNGAVDALVISNQKCEQVYTLQGAERPYRTLIEHMQQGAATVSLEGTILYANRHLATLLHSPLENLIGSSIQSFMKPIDEARWENLLAEGQPVSQQIEWTLCDTHGQEIPIYISIGRLSLEEITAMCLVITDLTEQKRIQAEFKLLYELAIVFSRADTINEALTNILTQVCQTTDWQYGEIWFLDERQEKLICDPTWYGHPAIFNELALFRHISETKVIRLGEGLIGQAWAEKHPVCMVNVIAESGFWYPETGLQTTLKTAIAIPILVDEQVIAIMGYYKNHIQEDNAHFSQLADTIAAQVGSFIRRKQTEIQLREHQAQVTKMAKVHSTHEIASMLAHELNQPLAAITVYAQTCLRKLLEAEYDIQAIKDALNKVANQSLRAGKIIHAIKDLVNKNIPQYKKCHLHDIIKSVIVLFGQEFRAQSVRCELNLANQLPCLQLDPIQIEQVFTNLIQNALTALKEANRSDAKINVQTQLTANDEIMVTITDNGTGLSEYNIKQLFEPYFTTKQEGMGLGLAICRTIVEAHSGQLSACNAPESGACFQFTLPINLKA